MSQSSWKEKSKSHICDTCGKGFHSVHQLAQHTRIHTGEKPYKCSFCEKAFKQLSHLQQHTRLHTGERPYKCPSSGCSKSFIQLSNLNQHLKTHRNTSLDTGSNVVCTFCARIFKTESSLLTHKCKPRKASRPSAPGRVVEVRKSSDNSAFEALDALPIGNDNGNGTSGSSESGQSTNGNGKSNGASSSGHSHGQSPKYQESNGRNYNNHQQPKNSNHDQSSRSHNSSDQQQPHSPSKKRGSPSKNRHQQEQVTTDDFTTNYGMNPMNGTNHGHGQQVHVPQQTTISFESNFGSSFWSCPVCKLNFSSEQGFSTHFEEMKFDHRHQVEAQLFLSAMVGQQQQQIVVSNNHNQMNKQAAAAAAVIVTQMNHPTIQFTSNRY